jgi:hypothetical protein
MSLFVLGAIFRVFGIRGPIPGNDDFRGGPDRSSLAANGHSLTQILAILVVIATLLSLIVWAAVWLAIKSL